MNINALIIDDEPKIREVLKIKISRYCPHINIIGEAENNDDAYDKIQHLSPDLIFLDIAMPGGSGLDLIQRFRHINFEIIFVTGFDNFALEALKLSAIDYILKPIKTEHLVQSVEKAIEKLQLKNMASRYELLKHNSTQFNHQNNKIAIPGAHSYEFVNVHDIIRCEGWQKYTKIFVADGKVIVSSYNIGMFKNILEHQKFYMTHKSHLVNEEHIVRYSKDGTLYMSDGSIVPVARRKKEEFINDIVKIQQPQAG